MQQIKDYWKGAAAEFKRVSSVVLAGMFCALGIALKSMLTLNITATLRVSFTFLSAALAGYMSGPLVAGMAAMIVDVVGYLLVPTGAYFFGFTLNAFLTGMIFGVFLYNRPVRLWRTAAAVACNTVVVRLLINPVWLKILYGNAYIALVLERVVSNLIQLPFQIGILFLLLRVAEVAKRQIPQRR